jgi:hypothetical protein
MTYSGTADCTHKGSYAHNYKPENAKELIYEWRQTGKDKSLH